jgi:hypothetical protein
MLLAVMTVGKTFAQRPEAPPARVVLEQVQE